MSNEYDDLIAAQPTEKANEYDVALQLNQDQQRTQLRSSLAGAVQTNPDQYAQATQLSRQTGVPAEVVHRNLPEVSHVAKVNEYDQMLQDSPKLQEMMRNPDFAKVAHDDLGVMGSIEKTLQVGWRGARSAAAGVGPDLAAGVAGVGQAGSEALRDYIGEPLTNIGLTPENPFADMAQWFAQTRHTAQEQGDVVAGTAYDAQGRRMAMLAGDSNWKPEEAGRIERDVEGGLRMLGQNAPPMAAALITGQPELALGGITGEVAGQQYGESRDAGLSSSQALPYAASQAGIQLVASKLPVGVLFKNLNEGSPLWKTFLQSTSAAVPAQAAASFLSNVNEWANLNPDKSFKDMMAEQPSALLDTLLQTVVATGAESGLGHVARYASVRQAQDRQAANEANADNANLTDLTAQAAASKLRARDPQSFQSFVETAAADGPVQDVYVDAKQFAQTLQQSGVDPREVARTVPAVGEQLGEALQTGGDLRIPIGEYAARIAGQKYAQDLLPHLRTSPDALSSAEAKTFQQNEAERFKQDASDAMAAHSTDTTFQQSAGNVESHVFDQLTQANRFTGDVNHGYASMVRDFYATQAHKLGVTPEELYAKYPLSIKAESVAGDRQFGQNIRVPREENLSPEAHATQEKFAQQIEGHTDKAIEDYGKLSESEGGRVLNTDVARELSPDYRKDRTKSTAVHEPASALIKEMYARKLSEAPKAGQDPVVIFSAGGTGAGKTTGIRTLAERVPEIDRAQIVYDTNMNSLPGAVGKIEQALAAGKEAHIIYTYRHPVEALVQGALTRASRMEREQGSGRTVPLSEHAKTHVGSLKVIRDLVQRYADDPRVKIDIIDNSRGKGQAAPVDVAALPHFDYNSLVGELHASLESEHSAGRISDSIHRGFKGPDGEEVVRPAVRGSLEQGGPREAAGAARGQITFGRDLSQPSVISLLKNADLSTFLHESGHFFLEVHSDIASRADAPDSIKADSDTLLKWFGVKDMDAWRGMSLEEQRPFHEQFARGFEAYLFDGKAPNAEMQGVFSKFRSWLLNVYKSLSNLHVDLTPEVRGVFDRMLATDQQIQVAENMRAYKPLFADRKSAGMTEAEWLAYQDIGAKATEDAEDELQKRSLRDMRWASNARSKALKELQATAEEKRKATRAEAAAEVNAEPIYQVQRWLRKGEMTSPEGEEIKADKGFRLNTDAVKEMYPETSLNRPDLEKLRGLTSPEGMHPDQVAEMFGFSSGDELVRKLTDLEPAKEVIDAVTDQKMLERYGDLTDPVAMGRAADAAVHNEARSKFVATELRALQRAMNAREKTPAGGSVNVLAKAAREFATETISRKRVRDVKPAQFDAAETRAAQASEKATRKGDFSTAVMEKRNQLINGYASKAAHEAVDEVSKGADYLKKFDSEGTRKNLDPDYTDQIDALLERFDLRTGQSGTAIDKRKALAEWITKQEDLGFTPDIDPQLRNEAFRTSYKDMTVEQFRGLVDAVRNIEHLGRLKKKLLTAQDGRDFAAHVASAEQSIRDNAKKTIPEELEHNAFSSRIKAGVKEFFAMHRKFASLIQQMDGFVEGGPLWETFVRPLNHAGDFEATRRAQATRELGDIFKPIEKAGKLRQKMFIPELGKSLSREGRLSIALNWGNETNRRRVMEGDKWTPGQVGVILDTLSKPEWDFVQGVWDHINSYWPEIAAKERRVTGNTPEKVEASPVITKHGEYKGGYYPIKYDPVRSTRAESDSMAEIVKQTMQGMYTRATTRRGHIQERTESVERPMRKDLGVVFEHVNQVVHDLAYHEYLIDANRLLRAGPIDGAIRDHYGPEVLGVMRDVLKDVAAGDIPAQNAFERGMNYLRTGSTVAGLGWSVMTSLLQPIGLTQSMVRIGPKWVGKGLATWIGDAAHMEASTKYIFEKSPMMKLRAATFNRELNEIRNRVSKDTGGMLEPVKESFYYLIGKLQLVADVPTWLGQYEKEMAGSGDEKRAIDLADQAVIDAQGHGQIKDLAAIQRGGPFMKLFTNFYSFFNTTLNLTADSFNKTNFKKPGDVGRMAVDMLLLYTIPSVMGTLVHSAVRGDDKDKLLEQIIRDHLNYMTGTLVGVRELGSALNGNDYSGPASLRFYATMSKLVKQVGAGQYNKATVEALNNIGGVLFHYPAGQVQRTAEGVAAMVNGDTNNPGAIISGPPPKPH